MATADRRGSGRVLRPLRRRLPAATLAEAIRYSLLAPGKRLRPLLGAGRLPSLRRRSIEAALPAACAVEMIHSYSLIHDDLPAMDDDDLRRGRPTNHKVFGEGMADSGRRRPADPGLRNAWPRGISPPRRPPPAAAPSWPSPPARAELVGGQADDLAEEGKVPGAAPTVERAPPTKASRALEAIHRRKTGAMLLVSLRLGALVAGADAAATRRARRLRRRGSGLTFQIMDDLLDVARVAKQQMGKRVGKDAARGKLTFPGLLGVEESQRRADALTAEAIAALGSARIRRRGAWKTSLGMSWKGITNMADSDPVPMPCCRTIDSPDDLRPLSLDAARAAGRRNARRALQRRRRSHGALRVEPRRRRALPGAAHDVRLPPRPADLGHRPPDLSAQADHRPLPRVRTIRTKGGLMGYPNPHESDYDLFMTGHAGCSVSTALGLKSGDDLMPGQDDRHAVAVIGDGAFPSGIVFEALNNAGGLKKKLLVILNDNKMSICPRVGGVADYLDRLRMNPLYTGLKTRGRQGAEQGAARRRAASSGCSRTRKNAVKAGLHGGMLFEELGFRYIGPIDGHNIGLLKQYLEMCKDSRRPGAAARRHREGARLRPGRRRSGDLPHAGAVPARRPDGRLDQEEFGSRAYTNVASAAIHDQLQNEPARHGADRRDVPREQARSGPRRFPDAVLRHRHLRIARRGVRRRPGEGRPAADRRYLQHVPATQLRSDLPGSRRCRTCR